MSQYPSMVELSSLDGANGFRINGEATGYSAGTGSSAGDVNGDGFDDVIVGAASASPNGPASGASYIVFGKASWGALSLGFELSSLDGNNGFKINGEATRDVSGYSVASGGDVNGDGFADMIVGAFGAAPNGAGASYVIFGKASGFGAALELSSLDGNNGFKINGEATGDSSGCSVSSAGDVNGDGFADLIVGAPNADPNGSGSGASYVVFGAAAGFGATLELSGLDGNNGFQISGEAIDDRCGGRVSSAGDLNGDGFADLIVGANYADPNGDASGASYVVFGKASGWTATLELSSLDGNNGFKINGEEPDDIAGWAVSSAGDVNGDGFADVIVAAQGADPNGDWSGASYVVFGKASSFGATLELSSLDGNNGFQINGEAAYDLSGVRVASAGDVNGDGLADVIVGAYFADGGSGASYVVFGKASGFNAVLELSSLDGANGFKIRGESGNSGYSVSSAGDVDGDGFDDVIVGARAASPNGAGSGACYVIFGSMPGEAVTRTGTAIANTIHGGNFDDVLSGRGGGDSLYGHGGHDVLLGGMGNDSLTGGAGADVLAGGAGADRFIYASVSDSTGASFDTVKKGDFVGDTFDAPATVTGIDSEIGSGALRRPHFDSDLAAAADADHLGANHAVLFTPDAGNFHGDTFLVVDLNGVVGYQASEDLVVQLVNAQNLASLGIEDFI